MPGTVLGHEGAGKVVEVGAEVTRVKAGRPHHRVVHPGLRHVLVLPARLVAPLRQRDGRDDVDARQPARRQPVHGDDRARHVRRADDVQRGLDRQDRERPPRRAARADRLRRHHRRRRGAQHRRGAAGHDGRRHRVRRCRPGRHPGRAHRRRVADHRRRPGRDEAQDRGAARRHRLRRPERRRPGRAGAGSSPAAAASTTRSRSSVSPRRRSRRTT